MAQMLMLKTALEYTIFSMCFNTSFFLQRDLLTMTHNTPLHFAALNNSTDVVQILLNDNALIDTVNEV